MLGAQGRAFIDNALSTAKLTGYLPDPKELQRAISSATGDLGKQVYATQFEADRDRLILAGKLSGLESISGDQLTEAEKQLASLDGILENARQQIDALRGIDTSILGVDTRIAMLADAILAETAARNAVKAGSGGGGGGSGGGGGQGSKPVDTIAEVLNGSNGAQVDLRNGIGYQSGTGLTYMVDDIRSMAADLLNSGNGTAVYDAIKSQGFTLAQANSILGIPAGEAEAWAQAMGLPIYHSGTDYVPKTGFALLQQGEAVIPAALNRNNDNGARLEKLVEGLTAEVKRLQGLVAEGNEHQRTTADLLDNVTEGGNAMRSETVGA